MNLVAEKSYSFAIKIIRMYKSLSENKREFVMSKQLLRSGTAIGALIKEAQHAQSKADFLNKMTIALKEANETEYWLMLLRDTDYISDDQFTSINNKCDEVLRLLVSIVKSCKVSLKRT
jgi:four helix bundle protein